MLPAFAAGRQSTMMMRAARSLLPSPMPAASSALLSSGAPASAALAFAPVRSLHFPRTVRGVGPAPRVSSFMKQPWLRRRLAQARARAWSRSHPTPVLQGQVQSAVDEKLTVDCKDFVTGQSTGTVELDGGIFNVPLRRDIVWEVVRWQRACRRAGTHKTKDRSEVFGSGKKARPQKGSGRARMGDPHAPHHKGGGHAFPKRPSSYAFDLPASTIAQGKRVALAAKAAEGNLFVIDKPYLPTHSEADLVEALAKHKWASFLMVHLDGELDPNLALACRRSPHYRFLSESEFNVYDTLLHRRLVLTRGALNALQWRLAHKRTGVNSKTASMRFLVGSHGGGYTREEIDFVRPADVTSDMRVADGVDVDGLKLVVKSKRPYVTPIHWP